MFSPANGARAGVRRIAILITDGQANRETNDTQLEANLTKQAGIEIFAVGMTPSISVQELRSVVSPPNETHFFYVDIYKDIESAFPALMTDICASPEIALTSTTASSTSSTSVASGSIPSVASVATISVSIPSSSCKAQVLLQYPTMLQCSTALYLLQHQSNP